MATITSVNSVFTLSIAGLYDFPQTLQGYAADDAFAIDPVATAETTMGVDGKLSGGYVPMPKSVHITLQANSASIDIFSNWQQAQDTVRELYIASAIIEIPSLGGVYSFNTGFLKSASLVSDAKKVMQPRKFQIEFQDFAWARTL